MSIYQCTEHGRVGPMACCAKAVREWSTHHGAPFVPLRVAPMTDRTPPQEREREARWACETDLLWPNTGPFTQKVERLDAYARAVAARVRAELREKVEGMRAERMIDVYDTGYEGALSAVLAALAEETTG